MGVAVVGMVGGAVGNEEAVGDDGEVGEDGEVGVTVVGGVVGVTVWGKCV